MTLAGDSILVTPGSGATVATHTVSAKEHQVVMLAEPQGHLVGTVPTYWFSTGASTHVAAASTLHLDLFNADATAIVRIRSIVHTTLVEAAVTGVGIRFQMLRTSAVGTGGTPLTAWEGDVNQTDADADITARSKATAGATAGASLMWWNRSVEETVAPANGGTQEVLPLLLQQNGIVLRQNTGIRINQESNTAVGSSAFLIGFTVE
jgi:hypothetical protein